MNRAVIPMLIAAAVLPTPAAGGGEAAERPGGDVSEIRLYGRGDLNVTRYENNNGVDILRAGLWNGSRLGLKGGVYLGAGIKPVFRLESGFGTEKGKFELAQRRRVFGRLAYLGVETNLGTVTAGRLYPASDPVVDLVDIALPGLLSSYKSQFYWQMGRLENALLYTSPTLGGVQARVGYALGEKSGPARGAIVTGGAMYSSGPLSAGASLESWRTSAVGDSSAVYNFWNLAARFELGAAALVAGFSFDDANFDLSAKTALRSKTYAVGATLPAGSSGAFVSLLQVVKPEKVSGMHIATLRYAYFPAKGASLYSQINLANTRAAKTYGRKSEFIFGVHYRFDVSLLGD